MHLQTASTVAKKGTSLVNALTTKKECTKKAVAASVVDLSGISSRTAQKSPVKLQGQANSTTKDNFDRYLLFIILR